LQQVSVLWIACMPWRCFGVGLSHRTNERDNSALS
jgi:hypothetical protein